MALIKNTRTGTMAREAIVLDLGDLNRQAETMKAAAEEEARRIVADAERERRRLIDGAEEEGRKKGYDDGFAKGIEEGREQGRAEALEQHRQRLETICGSWQQHADHFARTREHMIDRGEHQVLELAVEVARRVTKRHAMLDPENVRDRLREALSLVLAPTKLTIRLCEEDVALVESALPGIVSALGIDSHTDVVADAELGPGACVVRTEQGSIDASIDTMLDRITEELLPAQDAHPPRPTPPSAQAEEEEEEGT